MYKNDCIYSRNTFDGDIFVPYCDKRQEHDFECKDCDLYFKNRRVSRGRRGEDKLESEVLNNGV